MSRKLSDIDFPLAASRHEAICSTVRAQMRSRLDGLQVCAVAAFGKRRSKSLIPSRGRHLGMQEAVTSMPFPFSPKPTAEILWGSHPPFWASRDFANKTVGTTYARHLAKLHIPAH